MTNQCEHGQLARVCELCEKDAEIAQLRQYLDTAQRRASVLGDEVAGLRNQLHLAEVARAAQVEGLTQGAAGWRERANQLEAEVAGLREDSARYHYLRDVAWHAGSLIFYAERYGPEDWDAHIDAALAARKGAT